MRSKNDFKGRHFKPGLIVQAFSWYLHYPSSDLEKMLLERGLKVDHCIVNHWVLAYVPLVEGRLTRLAQP